MKSRETAPGWVRHLLLLTALGVIALLLIVPALNVLFQAFSKGLGAYFSAILDGNTLHAIFLTTAVALIAVAINLVFGVAAS